MFRTQSIFGNWHLSFQNLTPKEQSEHLGPLLQFYKVIIFGKVYFILFLLHQVPIEDNYLM